MTGARKVRVRRLALCALLGMQGLLVAAPPAVGAAQRSGAAYVACMSRANSTRDMQDCQTKGLAEANAQLAVAYAKARAALPADQQAKLRVAESRWVAFRISDCQVFYGNQTGTLATVQGGSCMIDRTEDRIKNLRGFITK